MDEDGYDAEMFIAEVKQRPILWNTTLEEYNDRSKRQAAWDELTRAMYPNLADKDFSKTEATLMKKWKNIKDNYVRNRRRLKTGKITKKKRYIYWRHLAFLKETLAEPAEESVAEDGNAEASVSSEDNENECSNGSFSESNYKPSIKHEVFLTPTISTSLPDASCAEDDPLMRKRILEETMITYLRTQGGTSKLDEDQCFFDSILPTVRQFDVDKKLQFRIQVMSLIQNMRKK